MLMRVKKYLGTWSLIKCQKIQTLYPKSGQQAVATNFNVLHLVTKDYKSEQTVIASYDASRHIT